MINTPDLPHPVKQLLITCLSMVAIIGLCVITGWHLHLRPLVQIIPGAIPMQYNTALCLVVLALSGVALISQRIPRWLPALGGGLVSLMGMAVVFQYATGNSLGINTFFFYPWDQTLSSDPGRMALTIAASFSVAGATLCLLILSNRTLIAFVIAHTFPLSLGLTSLLGYLFGVTYVLPFQLGSQMAVHTATAFLIYGGAMLFYAWQYIPQTQEGLPKWSPSISIIMLPVFFVSLSSAFLTRSLPARITQSLLALGGVALLAVIIQKLTQVRILYKGLILTAIPLLFVLGFIMLFNQQRRTGEQAQVWALHSEAVIKQSHLLSENLLEAESGIRGFIVTGNEDFLRNFNQLAGLIPEDIKTLKTLVRDNPAQLAKAEKLGEKAAERLAALDELKTTLQTTGPGEAVILMKAGYGKQLMDEFRGQMNEFRAEEERLNMLRNGDIQTSWQQFDWLLVSSSSAGLLLALTLVFLFTRGIGRRLQIVAENARALTERKPLAEPLTGTDEIARVDLVFHEMAEVLQKGRDELESKVKERTEELLQSNEMLRHQIEERKQTENALRESELQLIQSQKLEAIGQLAGGIAHDFNNLLTIITGYSDLTLRGFSANDPGKAKVQEIKAAALRAAALTRQLLAFSRKQALQPKVLDLNTLITDVSKMLRRLIGEDVEFITLLRPEAGCVSADPGQIEQVLMNLVINARDAMPQGGKVIIETSNVELDKAYTNMHMEVNPGKYVMLSISDTGTGMNKETQNRIFEPFFTTKEIGRGTGLGLATVYGIIKQSGGNIWVYSEVGNGTTFKIYLPLVEEEAEARDFVDKSEVVLRGTERILLVEDEPMLRKLACSILEESGYKVLEAGNGVEALDLCDRYGGQLDLLLTDVVMPLMSGRKLVEKLTATYPQIRVLFMSGYTDDAVIHHGLLEHRMPFLEKPFAPNDLLKKVREILDAPEI